MKVCGVEIKANEAIICILSLEDGVYNIPDLRAQRVVVSDATEADKLRYFQSTFAKLMEDYNVDKVIIKARALKGRFAGGAVGFKLEAAIQLIAGLDVSVTAAAGVKKSIKRSQGMIDFRDTGLKNYQETAFDTAFAYLEADASAER